MILRRFIRFLIQKRCISSLKSDIISMLHTFGTPWQREISMVFFKMAVKYVFLGLWLMKIISDTIPIIHELSKDISSCTSSFFMSNRHFHSQMLYYTRRPRDLAFGLLNFRKGFFSMERIITYTISTGESGENVLGFLRKKGFSKHISTTMKRAEQWKHLSARNFGKWYG